MAIYQYDMLVPAIHAETFVADDATVIGNVTLELLNMQLYGAKPAAKSRKTSLTKRSI